MLDQNTDRMWYVIGALVVGAGIILLANGTLPDIFASVTESFESSASKATDVISSIGNEPIGHMTDTYEVFGESVQNGNPTPERAVPIQSMNEISINGRRIHLDEPLRSVGETKDRLYRDSNGLWKIERNVAEHIANSSTHVTDTVHDYVYILVDIRGKQYSDQSHYMHSHAIFRTTSAASVTNGEFTFSVQFDRYAYGKTNSARTSEEVKNWLIEEYDNGTPLTILYEMETSTVKNVSQNLQDKLNAAL